MRFVYLNLDLINLLWRRIHLSIGKHLDRVDTGTREI